MTIWEFERIGFGDLLESAQPHDGNSRLATEDEIRQFTSCPALQQALGSLNAFVSAAELRIVCGRTAFAYVVALPGPAHFFIGRMADT